MPLRNALLRPSGGVAALPGYSLFLTPWAGIKSGAANLRNQNSTYLGGGNFGHNPPALNDDNFDWDLWLDKGTYKFAVIYQKSAAAGIINSKLGGSSQGTVDFYAAGGTDNNYSEITGIVVSLSALNAFKVDTTSKNGASSNYETYVQTMAWIRTGA